MPASCGEAMTRHCKLLATLAATVEASHRGNRNYRFSTDIEQPTHFYLNEEWETMTDFEHHSTLPETLEIGSVTRNGATDVKLCLHSVASTRAVPFATAGA